MKEEGAGRRRASGADERTGGGARDAGDFFTITLAE